MRGVLADRSADAEVEGVDHLAVLLDLLAFEADVGDPALAAGVGAAGDVQLDLLVEAGQPLFHLADQPLRERLGLGDRQLAELGAGAGDGAAPEGRDLDLQAELVEIDDQSRVRALGTLTRTMFCMMVARRLPSPYCSARSASWISWSPESVRPSRLRRRRQAGLLLRRDADVVAIDVVGDDVSSRARDRICNRVWPRSLRAWIRRSSRAHEEVLDARAGAVLAQLGLLLEDAHDGLDDTA
jgi:hypothetical protein